MENIGPSPFELTRHRYLRDQAYQSLASGKPHDFFRQLNRAQGLGHQTNIAKLRQVLGEQGSLREFTTSQIIKHEEAHLDYCLTRQPFWQTELRHIGKHAIWVAVLNLPLIFERKMGSNLEKLKKAWAGFLLAPTFYFGVRDHEKERSWGFKLLGERASMFELWNIFDYESEQV